MKRFFFLISLLFIMASCARVGSPVGGSKDTIPPNVIGSNIDTPRVNVPREIKELRIDFDEYITLKNIQRNLIISPPITVKKILPSSLANKYILIQWDQTLQENTTYNFNFGSSIADNNEGNILPYYNFAFSTGPEIDDLYISGEAKKIMASGAGTSANTESNIVVGLYQEKDSMDYRQKPYYISKADPDGYYELNYLSPGQYRVLAFDDENQNSVYDAGKESVGFLGEPLNVTESISGLDISLYPSRKNFRYIEMKPMTGGVQMIFEGNPQQVEIESLNEKLTDYKVYHRAASDTVFVWFDAQQSNVGIENSENLKFRYKTETEEKEVSLFYRYNAKDEMTIANSRGNMVAPNREFVIRSNYHIAAFEPEQWFLESDSIQQSFTAKISETNPFELSISSDFQEGKKYSLTVPKETVSSHYKSIAKSYRFDFEIDKTENYGSLKVNLINIPEQKFWLQMLNESSEVVYSQYVHQNEVNFTELKPGTYTLRILVDNNENGIWDSADFSSSIFAEDVYTLDKKITVRPMWEIRENWDVKPAERATDTPSENTLQNAETKITEEDE